MDYYRQLPHDVIIQVGKSSPGAASPNLMLLLGCRLGFVDESGIDSKLNESIVKNITGGVNITARPLYKDPITFAPTFQIFLLTNHMPIIDKDNAYERRLVLIPFLAEFTTLKL